MRRMSDLLTRRRRRLRYQRFCAEISQAHPHAGRRASSPAGRRFSRPRRPLLKGLARTVALYNLCSARPSSTEAWLMATRTGEELLAHMEREFALARGGRPAPVHRAPHGRDAPHQCVRQARHPFAGRARTYRGPVCGARNSVIDLRIGTEDGSRASPYLESISSVRPVTERTTP